LQDEKKIKKRNMKGIGYLDDIGIDGRIILKSILKKYDVRLYTGLIWLKISDTLL
jgi:hypothetical protein